MTDLRDLPPDPFEDEGVDPFAVEAAERLAREDVSGADPRWEHIGGEPTLDDFDQAGRELHSSDAHAESDAGQSEAGPFSRMTPWLPAIAVLVVIAMALTYVLR